MSDNPQHPASWYAASAHAAPSHPHLAGAQQVDVCVLGAGLTGLTTALELAEAGYKVVVLESESVGWGASRSEEHTSKLQSLMRISYAVFCLKKKTKQPPHTTIPPSQPPTPPPYT